MLQAQAVPGANGHVTQHPLFEPHCKGAMPLADTPIPPPGLLSVPSVSAAPAVAPPAVLQSEPSALSDGLPHAGSLQAALAGATSSSATGAAARYLYCRHCRAALLVVSVTLSHTCCRVSDTVTHLLTRNSVVGTRNCLLHTSASWTSYAQFRQSAAGAMSGASVLMWVTPMPSSMTKEGSMMFQMTPAAAVPAQSWPLFVQNGAWAPQLGAFAQCALLCSTSGFECSLHAGSRHHCCLPGLVGWHTIDLTSICTDTDILRRSERARGKIGWQVSGCFADQLQQT